MRTLKKTFLTLYLFLALFAFSLTLPAAEIWQIGKVDNSNAEFLDQHQYLQKFSSGSELMIGKDSPKDAWPATQPGPEDIWAGSKSYTTAVVFDLPEVKKDVAYEFVFDGTAHYSKPPLFILDLNGTKQELQTNPNATSDVAINTGKAVSHSYKVTFAQNIFREKANKLTITSKSGSWFVYDRVALFTRTGKIEGLNIQPIRGVMKEMRTLSANGSPKSQEIYIRKFKVDYQGEILTQNLSATVEAKGNKHASTSMLNLSAVEHPYGFEAEALMDEIESTAKPLQVMITLKDDQSQVVAKAEATLPPERPWEVHLIHQTHLDIGYTHTQVDVLERQVQSLKEAIQYIEETKDYPAEAKFKWHPEGMWAIDEFFRTATDEEKTKFIAAAKARDIHLDVLYAQAMTGMYNEEELFELMGNAVRFGKEHGIVIDSTMQTDVPGYTWGLIPSLAQNGVKYLNIGPNHVHRVGRLYRWGDKPFWWVSPSGKEKVLCWMLGTGYYQFHGKPRDHELQESEIFRLIERYEGLGKEFPYDILMVRYGLEGDNGRPNRKICDAVKAWNEKYVYPKLVLARNSDTMAEMEKRYGDKLPVLRGDYTPYWEDGAASTSEATAINRDSHEKILQAQILWSMLNPGKFPFAKFDEAWTDLIMYDEHTWGAYNSISEPDSDFVKQQDDYKQEYAKRGARTVDALFQKALADRVDENSNVIEVFNTSSWPRKNWVMVDGNEKTGVTDAQGKSVISQQLHDGKLAFLAEVAPLSSRIFKLTDTAPTSGPLEVQGNSVLLNGNIYFTVDQQTGAILPGGLTATDHDGNRGLNDFLCIIGRNADENRDRTTENVKITVEDAGPFIATLVVESTAPNCEKLTRRLRYFAESDYLEITNIVDKKMERRPEGMFFAFPFTLENAKWHYDIPWAMPEVEKDQLPGANRNYYPIQRFCNLSNGKFGVDWLSLDAPLVQFEKIKFASPYNMDTEWLEHIEPNSTIYSWVCNNHWETNYKAGQDGRLVFRYVIHGHEGPFDQVKSQRFARDIYQPLIAIPVKKDTKSLDDPTGGLLAGSPVIVTSIKPPRYGNGVMIVRLYNTSDKSVTITGFSRMSLVNTVEEKLETISDSLDFVPYEIKTIRIDR